ENELRVRRADGVYRWILGRFVPLRDESGRIVKWYGVSTDIDDRKRAEILLHAKERDLEESQSRLEQAQRIAHVGHYEHDLETGIVIASDESYRILGLQPQDTITLTRAFELIHPDDRERVHQERNDAV